MPGQERLTDRNPLTAETASNNLKFYVVDEDKTTEHPDGDSFQVSKSELIEILGIENSSSGQRLKKVINIVDNTAAPPTEVSGDRYILDNTGASHANWDGASSWDIVEFNGTIWVSTTPEEGNVVYVDAEDKDAIYVDDGTGSWELRTISIPDEEEVIGTSSENTSVSGAHNIDAATLSHFRYTLTGNSSGTIINTPALGKSKVISGVVKSTTTESYAIPGATKTYGEYVADGSDNFVMIAMANNATSGLEIHVFYSQGV